MPLPSDSSGNDTIADLFPRDFRVCTAPEQPGYGVYVSLVMLACIAVRMIEATRYKLTNYPLLRERGLESYIAPAQDVDGI